MIGGLRIQPEGLPARIQQPRAAARPAVSVTRSPMTVGSFLALQRSAGNAAVGTLVAQRAAPGVKPVPAAAQLSVQRDDEAEEPAGCGFCIDPGPAGTQAHNQIQAKMGALGVDSEVKVAAGRGGGTNGRLDLARWDETSIEIGEIKPGHASGLALGRSDLEHYKTVLGKTKNPLFKGKTIRMLDVAGPAAMVFDNPGVALPQPQLLTTLNVGGVYGYRCTPPNSDYFTAGGQLKAGEKHVTPEALKAKKDFFDSECIRKKIKRQAVREERVKIVDRAGVTRLVKPAHAFALLQSRAFHVKHELENLSGEHHQRHRIATNAIRTGLLAGGPVFGPYGLAGLYDLATMPSLSIWTATQAAASKCDTAADIKTLTAALDELDKAIVAPRNEYLTYMKVSQPNTPAPAAGATPRQGAAPPVPAAKPATAGPAAPTAGQPAATGVDPLMIAALAGLVLLTFLILQPELGVAAVAGAAATGGAEAAGAVGAGEVLLGSAATAAEAALEVGCEEMASEVLLAGMTA